MSMEEETLKDASRVRDLVKSGEYFERARNWYDELYHRPMIERCFFILVTLLSAGTIAFSILTYQSMFPLETIKPYIIATEDIDRDVPQTMPLRLNPQQRVDEALVNYLLKDYVKNRESYNYNIEQIEARFSRIRQQSASEEFARYQALMDPQNRSSPLTYLSRDGYRKVTMSDYASFGLDFSQPEQRGQVYFTTITAKPGDEEARLQNWVADITFRFPPIQVDRETKRVMQWDAATNSYQLVNAITFTVVNYAVREQLTQTN